MLQNQLSNTIQCFQYVLRAIYFHLYYQSMEITTLSEVNGWAALSNVSTFMSHLEQRKQLNIFGELDAWLDFMQYLIKVQIHRADESRLKGKKRHKQLSKQLVRALKTLKNDQLIYYFNTIVQQIVNLIQHKLSPPPIENSNFLIIESYTRSYNLRIWKQKKLRFDRQNHIIYAQKDKKIKIYDLANYIVRRSSNTDYFCIVLQAINSVPLEKSRTVHIGFQYKNTYNLWFFSIQSSVRFRLWEKLCEMLGKKAMIRELIMKEDKMTVTKSTNDNQTHIKSSSFYSENQYAYKNKFQTQKKMVKEKEETNLTVQSFDQNSNYTTSICTIPDQQTGFKEISQNDESTILKESFTNKLLNQKSNISFEELHFECQKESQELKQKKRKAKIHSILLQNYKLSQIQNNSFFNQLTDQPTLNANTHMYQNANNPLNFKLTYLSFKTMSSQMLLTILQNILQGRQSAKQSKSVQKIEIKCILYSQNITINLEEHASYNRLYRPREFLYLRHVVSNKAGDYFVIDRSIEQQTFKERQHFVRGQLLRVTKVSLIKQAIKITTDFTMKFNGGLRLEQEVNHAKRYLHTFGNFIHDMLSAQQERMSQVKFYDCSRIVNEQAEENHQQDSSVSISFHKSQIASKQEQLLIASGPQPTLSKQISFYQIPRSNLVLENSELTEQMIFQELEKKPEAIENELIKMRKPFSPPRKANKHYLMPRLMFLEGMGEEVYDFKTETIPLWTSEWQVDEEKGGLVNRSNKPNQKKILKETLQQASRLTLLGKSSSKISFPVDILAPQSNLQRLVKSLSYAPTFFHDNHKLSTLQKFKKTIVYGILISLLSLNIQKPFITTLGQSYQGQISNNCKAYGEQLSTNPEIAALLMIAKDYSVSALVQPTIEIMMNSVRGQNKGVYKVKFSDHKIVNFTLPPGELSGLVYGQRVFQLLGKSYFWSQDQKFFLELNFQVNNQFTVSSASSMSKSDYFEGTIYEVKASFLQAFKQERKKPSQNEIKRKIEKVSGRWSKFVSFQDDQVSLRDVVLYEMSNEVNALPSDSTFRQDINQLKVGKQQLAQLMQFQIVSAQRQDDALRKAWSLELSKM